MGGSYSLVVVHRLLVSVASLVAELGLKGVGFSGCGSVSPALADRLHCATWEALWLGMLSV